MTTRVYIKGDIGRCPTGPVKFFDADTDTELELAEAQITLGIHSPNTIDFRRLNGSGLEHALLVPRPPCKASGEKVYQFTLEQLRDHQYQNTRLHATATELTVQDDGRLKDESVGALHVMAEISDVQLHGTHLTADEILNLESEVALRKLFDPMIIRKVIDGKVVHKGLPSRGAARDKAKELADAFNVNPAKRATCDECHGTGWYIGLIKNSPCSKGCKPKQ